MKFLTLCLLACTAYGQEPLGVRLCNPCNLRSERPQRWPGAIGVDPSGHLIFKDKISGIRACVINLRAYRVKRGLKTPHQIVKRITTNSGITIESFRNYRFHVSSYAGVCEACPINFANQAQIKALVRGIISFEQGKDPYTEEDYRKVFP